MRVAKCKMPIASRPQNAGSAVIFADTGRSRLRFATHYFTGNAGGPTTHRTRRSCVFRHAWTPGRRIGCVAPSALSHLNPHLYVVCNM